MCMLALMSENDKLTHLIVNKSYTLKHLRKQVALLRLKTPKLVFANSE